MQKKKLIMKYGIQLYIQLTEYDLMYVCNGSLPVVTVTFIFLKLEDQRVSDIQQELHVSVHLKDSLHYDSQYSIKCFYTVPLFCETFLGIVPII